MSDPLKINALVEMSPDYLLDQACEALDLHFTTFSLPELEAYRKGLVTMVARVHGTTYETAERMVYEKSLQRL